jgi:iron complex transport system permease protein
VNRQRTFYALILTGLAGTVVGELAIGASGISVRDALAALTGGSPLDPVAGEVVRQVRLPRALTAMAGGAGLAVSGLVLQSLFRNPLAGPWALGITAGARVGAAVIVVLASAAGTNLAVPLGSGVDATLVTGAFLGSVATLAAVSGLASSMTPVGLLILGLMFHYAGEALTGVILHFTTQQQVRVFDSWKAASFHTASPDDIQILLPVVALGLAIVLSLRKSLNAMLLGDQYARSVGVRVVACRRIALGSLAGLAGVVTAFCGVVVFIDLAVPHLCRYLLKTADIRVLMPATIAVGAFVGLFADVIVHLPWERQILALSDVTSLIGAPIVIAVMLRARRVQERAAA